MRLTAITFLIGFVLVLVAALQTELNHRAKMRHEGTAGLRSNRSAQLISRF
jgi:hypothetical protein